MRILFYDDSIVYVTTEQGERIKQAITSGIEWIEVDDTMYAVKSIKQIQAEKPVQEVIAIEPGTPSLPEDQRIHNIAKIRQMKIAFMKRMAKK